MSNPTALQFTTRDGSSWEPRFIKAIISEKCTRCGFCRKVCPAGVFSEDRQGQIIVGSPGSCRGCAVCERMCKAAAIICRPLSELPPFGSTHP